MTKGMQDVLMELRKHYAWQLKEPATLQEALDWKAELLW